MSQVSASPQTRGAIDPPGGATGFPLVHELDRPEGAGAPRPASESSMPASPPPTQGGSLQRRPTTAPGASVLGGPELRFGAVSGDRIRAGGWQLGINLATPPNSTGTTFNAGLFHGRSSGTLDGLPFVNAQTGVTLGLTHAVQLDARTRLSFSPQLRLTESRTNDVGSLQFDLRPTVGLTRNLIDGDVKLDLGVQLTPGLTRIWNQDPVADQLQFRPSGRIELPISFGANKVTPYYNLDLRFDLASGTLVGEGHTFGVEYTRSIGRNLQLGVGAFYSPAVDESRQIVNRSASNGINNAGGFGVGGALRWTF